MAFQKKCAYEAYMAKRGLSVTELPRHLQAAIRLHKQHTPGPGQLAQDYEQHAAQAAEIAEDIAEWWEDQEDEPTPAPVPEVATAPLTPAQVLQQLYGQGRTRLTAKELKAEGFTANPGTVGGTWGNYVLSKALFGSTFTLSKKR